MTKWAGCLTMAVFAAVSLIGCRSLHRGCADGQCGASNPGITSPAPVGSSMYAPTPPGSTYSMPPSGNSYPYQGSGGAGGSYGGSGTR